MLPEWVYMACKFTWLFLMIGSLLGGITRLSRLQVSFDDCSTVRVDQARLRRRSAARKARASMNEESYWRMTSTIRRRIEM